MKNALEANLRKMLRSYCKLTSIVGLNLLVYAKLKMSMLWSQTKKPNLKIPIQIITKCLRRNGTKSPYPRWVNTGFSSTKKRSQMWLVELNLILHDYNITEVEI